MHRPGSSEAHLELIEEEEGEYVAEAALGGAGVHEIHVEIEDTGVEGKFPLPVLGEDTSAADGKAGDGDGH